MSIGSDFSFGSTIEFWRIAGAVASDMADQSKETR